MSQTQTPTFMKFVLYIFCFCTCINTDVAFGQNDAKTDSLKRVLVTQKGLKRIKTLDNLAWRLKYKDSLGIEYALEQLKLSRNIKNVEFETKALNMLGKAAKRQKHFKDAEKYLLEALQVSKKHTYEHGIARAYNELGSFYENQGKNVQAIDAYLSSSESFESQGKLDAAAKATWNLGNLYKKIEAYPEALQYYLKSLEFREKQNDSLGLAKIYGDLAALSKDRENYEEMLRYAFKSKQLYQELNHSYGIFIATVEIARAHDYLNQDEKSKEVYAEALPLISMYEIEDASRLYHNLATFYKKMKKQDSALYYYQKAQKIFKQNNDYRSLSINHNNLGNLYVSLGDYEKSLSNFNQSLALQKKVKDTSLLQKTYWSLANYHEKTGDFKKAFKYKDSSEKVREDISKKIKDADRFDLKYLNTKREKEIVESKTEILFLKQQRKIQIIIIVLIALIILFFVMLRSRKLKQEKKLTELAFEQQKIETELIKEKQQQQLEEMLQEQERKAISSMINGQEEERERIAKDLHDRLGSMLSVVKIHYKSVEDNLEKIQKETKSQYEKANELLDEACEAVREIAHNMVSGTLTKFGLVPALKELKQKIEETKKLQIELLSHGLDNRLDNKTEIQLYRIIQELLNNILKHAKATEVTIQLLKIKHGVNIMVTDNGIGFDAENLIIHEGMGLKSIRARVEEMNGEFTIDSSKGNGTTVTIELLKN